MNTKLFFIQKMRTSSPKKNHYIFIYILFLVLYVVHSCQTDDKKSIDSYAGLLAYADSAIYSSPRTSDSIYRYILSQKEFISKALYAKASLGVSQRLVANRNFDSAAILISEAGATATKLGDTTLIFDYLNQSGAMNLYQGNNDEALYYFNKGLILARQAGEKSNIAASRINIGKVYLEQGDYSNAMRLLSEGLTSARELQNIDLERVALLSLATLSAYLNEYNNAIRFIKQAIELNKQKRDMAEYATALSNLGIYYKNSAKMDSALWSYQEALQIYTGLKDTFSIVRTRYNIGIIYKNQKQYARAEAEMKDIYAYCLRENISQGQTYALLSLASVYEETNRVKEGIVLADSAIAMAKRLNLINNLALFYERKHSLLALNKQFREAYEAAQVSRHISDSLTGIEKQKEILELNARYENERKESENSMLRKENEIKKSQLAIHRLVLLAAILALALTVVFFASRHRKLKHQELLAETRSQKLEIENKNSRIELEHAGLVYKLKQEELNRVGVENQLKSEQIEKLELQTSLKEQELVFHALARAELKQLLQNVNESLKPFIPLLARKKDQNAFAQVLSGFSRDTAKDPLSEFEILFRQLHPEFYEKLLGRCPQLTKSELHISAMIRLNLATKDMAGLVNLSISTIETNRYHIRKKLNLDQGENLTVYMMMV